MKFRADQKSIGLKKQQDLDKNNLKENNLSVYHVPDGAIRIGLQCGEL